MDKSPAFCRQARILSSLSAALYLLVDVGCVFSKQKPKKSNEVCVYVLVWCFAPYSRILTSPMAATLWWADKGIVISKPSAGCRETILCMAEGEDKLLLNRIMNWRKTSDVYSPLPLSSNQIFSQNLKPWCFICSFFPMYFPIHWPNLTATPRL